MSGSRLLCCAVLGLTFFGSLGSGGCAPKPSAEKPPKEAKGAKETKETPPDASQPAQVRDTLLASAIELLSSPQRSPAAHQLAAQRLNQYLAESRSAGETPIEPLDSDVRRNLAARLSPMQLQDVESPQFGLTDSIHLETCFLFQRILEHVTARAETDLAKAEALFDWLIRNLQLEPSSSRTLPLPPRIAIMVGHGMEHERAWAFMELLRQIDIPCVLLAYESKTDDNSAAVYVPWLPAAIVDKQLYLFDTAIGLPVPGPGGKGVATLRQVRDDPSLLRQLDVDAQRPYRVQPEQLGKLIVLVESTPAYWSPRMRFLQQKLSGSNRAVLTSDLKQVVAKAGEAIGEGIVQELWEFPYRVDELSRQPEYRDEISGTKDQPLGVVTPYQFFGVSEARLAHLHGQFADAIPRYMDNRVPLNEWAQVERNRNSLISLAAFLSRQASVSPEVASKMEAVTTELHQRIREDCTYFLGLVKYEQREYEPAVHWLADTYLQKYATGKFVSGARYLLGRCAETTGDAAKAIEYYTMPDASPQGFGNLVRARRLGWTPPPVATPAGQGEPPSSDKVSPSS